MPEYQLAPSANSRPPSNKRPLSERIELGVGAFLFITVTIICLLALLFLSHSNRVATRGYELKMLQTKRIDLMRQNEVLSMQIADLQALHALENDSTIKRMVKVDRPQYIRTDTAVAQLGEDQSGI